MKKRHLKLIYFLRTNNSSLILINGKMWKYTLTSWLCDSNVSLKDISKQLSHVQVGITEKVHITKNDLTSMVKPFLLAEKLQLLLIF